MTQWNQVTGLSQTLAILLFVLTFALGFSLGERYERTATEGISETARGIAVENYVKANITALSPVSASLGGTFYVTRIEASGGVGTVEYEDGHSAYVGDFTYSADETGVRIASFTVREAVPDVPKEAMLRGIFECLPHKNTSGPQTLECAFGVKADDGAHYALDFSAVPFEDYSGIPTGERLALSGTLVPIEQLSTDYWQKYNIKGILRVRSVIR